jgi:hypothetical protein
VSPDRARQLLASWGRNNKRRDRLVTAAYEAGLSKREIWLLTGLARTTVDRIIGPDLFPPRAVLALVSRETSAVQVGDEGVQAAEHAQDGDGEPERPFAVG